MAGGGSSVPGAPTSVGGSPSKIPGSPSTLPGTPPNISGLLSSNNTELTSGFVHATWSGFLALQQKGFDEISRVTDMRHKICQKLSVDMQSYARSEAPWSDVTGDARCGLVGTYIAESGRYQSSAEISHTVDYGVFLETMGGGKWAIILPTLLYFAAHLQGLEEEVFAGASI